MFFLHTKTRGAVALPYFSSMWRIKKMAEQTTNDFYEKAQVHQKHLDGDFVETIQADCFRD